MIRHNDMTVCHTGREEEREGEEVGRGVGREGGVGGKARKLGAKWILIWNGNENEKGKTLKLKMKNGGAVGFVGFVLVGRWERGRGG
jgi:hypothetical protein